MFMSLSTREKTSCISLQQAMVVECFLVPSMGVASIAATCNPLVYRFFLNKASTTRELLHFAKLFPLLTLLFFLRKSILAQPIRIVL